MSGCAASASFAARTARFHELRSDPSPEPGAYSPQHGTIAALAAASRPHRRSCNNHASAGAHPNTQPYWTPSHELWSEEAWVKSTSGLTRHHHAGLVSSGALSAIGGGRGGASSVSLAANDGARLRPRSHRFSAPTVGVGEGDQGAWSTVITPRGELMVLCAASPDSSPSPRAGGGGGGGGRSSRRSSLSPHKSRAAGGTPTGSVASGRWLRRSASFGAPFRPASADRHHAISVGDGFETPLPAADPRATAHTASAVAAFLDAARPRRSYDNTERRVQSAAGAFATTSRPSHPAAAPPPPLQSHQPCSHHPALPASPPPPWAAFSRNPACASAMASSASALPAAALAAAAPSLATRRAAAALPRARSGVAVAASPDGIVPAADVHSIARAARGRSFNAKTAGGGYGFGSNVPRVSTQYRRAARLAAEQSAAPPPPPQPQSARPWRGGRAPPPAGAGAAGGANVIRV